jgi:hypothetical protein
VVIDELNPATVINRSFGGPEPGNLGIQNIKGLQDNGVMAVAKRFPATATPTPTRTWPCRSSTPTWPG